MQIPTTPAATPTKRGRILVVEDNQDAREILCELLTHFGYDVDSAADAEDALQKLDGARYDILFTDIHLPGIRGVELTMRALRDRPALRVIFASGDGPQLRTAVDFPHVVLPKPFQLHELSSALQRAEAA